MPFRWALLLAPIALTACATTEPNPELSAEEAMARDVSRYRGDRPVSRSQPCKYCRPALRTTRKLGLIGTVGGPGSVGKDIVDRARA